MSSKELELAKKAADYRGSVGLISPLYQTVIKSQWTGGHPTLDERCRIFNFSAKMEYKLFLINPKISFESADVVFLDEEHARLLLSRDEEAAKIASKTPADEAEKKQFEAEAEKLKETINNAVNENKVGGKLITVSYGETQKWLFPCKEEGIETLATAFSTAASLRRHVTVRVEPYTLKMTASLATPKIK